MLCLFKIRQLAAPRAGCWQLAGPPAGFPGCPFKIRFFLMSLQDTPKRVVAEMNKKLKNFFSGNKSKKTITIFSFFIPKTQINPPGPTHGASL